MQFTTILGAAAVLFTSVVSANWSSPHASLVWAPSNRVRVYGLDPSGYIMEWGQNDNGIGYWGPNRIGPQATMGSDLTALYTVNSGATTAPTIRVIYWDLNGRYHELMYTDANGWFDGGVLP